MAKLGGGMTATIDRTSDTPSWLVHVRPWHPAFWPWLWQRLDVQPGWVKPFAFCWMLARLLR